MIKKLIKEKFLILDGAMGTQIQEADIKEEHWQGNAGCNEILNSSAPEVIKSIHRKYLNAGADIIKTNTFGAIPWVLEDYDILSKTHELAYNGVKLAKEVTSEYENRFVAGAIGPGTKLPSLGHINYATMYSGYKITAKAMIEAGVDIFLLETAQDPLQIKAGLHAIEDSCKEAGVDIPIMVSVTIELSGTMLIGTDASTIATILEPFNILSLGFNCGTGPIEVKKHIQTLSQVWHKPISIHSNAGLPENRGGHTYYPMQPEEFAKLEKEFCSIDGVAFLGGCCGTTPPHIEALSKAVKGLKPTPPKGSHPTSIASLFGTAVLKQEPAPFLMGERSNATGSKAFRELLIAENYEGTLSVAQQQVKAGAHGVDISVGFAGRDEREDMAKVVNLYNQKVSIPLMADSTQVGSLEVALQNIGGKAIINSANLEDGEEKFDKICALAKRYGASLVCLAIDEQGMAKTKEQKVAIAERMYDRATKINGLKGEDLVFDLLTFTVGSGDEEYFTSAIETIDAIRELREKHPDVGAVLGLSNVSFGLHKDARIYLNSVFLHHCIEAGLTMSIVNVKHIIPYFKLSDEDKKVCEDLIFNRREDGDPLFKFIDYFSNVEKKEDMGDEEFNKLFTDEKIKKLLLDGDREGMLKLLESAKDELAPEKIVNEILIDGMKEIGELFGSGKMQLPFVLQSAEVMKASVDFLNPFLPKQDKATETTLVLGTVKGDVHDVGKNLVDIILSNNGFRVINIGIKADVEEFIKTIKENDVSAIGMSGLLVKSTSVMQENLQELKSRGINIPVLLGGAALTQKFIDDFCRPNYDGAIFYCKDAFDGITAMGRIEKGNLDTNLGEAKEQKPKEMREKKEIIIPPISEIKMPQRIEIPTPPFWGRRIFVAPNTGDDKMVKKYENIKKLAFDWLNQKILFKQRWGFKSKGMEKLEYEKLTEDEVIPTFERLKEEFLNGLFEPTIIYGYYPCRSDENSILIFDESEKGDNSEPLSEVIGRAEKILTFPRQGKNPHRALSDYYRSDKHDVLPLSVVSSGLKLSEYEGELFKAGKFKEYYLVHGLGVELAEALAEIIHKQIRIELNILKDESADLSEVKMRAYQGSRFSFGYPACPDLELNKPLFELLKPEEFGINLSETFQIVPEQSTSAMISYHPEALYYTI